jgi:hypothetical protein
MNESNITPIEQELAQALNQGGDLTTLDALIKLVKTKQIEIDSADIYAKALKSSLDNLESRVNELDGFLNENWEEMNHLGINEDIAKIFKLEIEQETEVTFNITGTATIKHPRGTDLEDMDMSELIDCDIVTRDYAYEVQDYDISDISGN